MVSPSHFSFNFLFFCLPGGGVDDVIRNHAGASLYDAECDRVMKSRRGRDLEEIPSLHGLQQGE